MKLRAPHYSDLISGVCSREDSKTFLELWEPKRDSEFFKRNAFNNRVRWQEKVPRLAKHINFSFLINLRLWWDLSSTTLERVLLMLPPWVTGWVRSIQVKVLWEKQFWLLLTFFSKLNISRLEAATLPENRPSRGLLEKVGFKYEGGTKLFTNKWSLEKPYFIWLTENWQKRPSWGVLKNWKKRKDYTEFIRNIRQTFPDSIVTDISPTYISEPRVYIQTNHFMSLNLDLLKRSLIVWNLLTNIKLVSCLGAVALDW